MKATLLYLIFVLLIINSSFSQTVQKKEMQKKTDSIAKPLTEKTVVRQPNLVPASSVNSKPKTETAAVTQSNVIPASEINTKPKTMTAAGSQVGLAPSTVNHQPSSSVPPAPNNSNATLLDAFVTVTTGTSAQYFPVTSGDNKDDDTHWSCGIFDQNGRPITSFHDDSNTDEYTQGTVTGPLQMHIDNSAVFGDFANNGHIHVNIAPNGNDTWGTTKFVLVMDFRPAGGGSNFSQRISWDGFRLSQDKRDIDFYFMSDGKNLVARQ
jgi:hypothetical protein